MTGLKLNNDARLIVGDHYDFGKSVDGDVDKLLTNKNMLSYLFDRDWKIGSKVRLGSDTTFHIWPSYAEIISIDELLDNIYNQPKMSFLKLYEGKSVICLKNLGPLMSEDPQFHFEDSSDYDFHFLTNPQLSKSDVELNHLYDFSPKISSLFGISKPLCKPLDLVKEVGLLQFQYSLLKLNKSEELYFKMTESRLKYYINNLNTSENRILNSL